MYRKTQWLKIINGKIKYQQNQPTLQNSTIKCQQNYLTVRIFISTSDNKEQQHMQTTTMHHTIEAQGLGCVVALPVSAIVDIVQVPGR